jgi:hypothetical protein
VIAMHVLFGIRFCVWGPIQDSLVVKEIKKRVQMPQQYSLVGDVGVKIS